MTKTTEQRHVSRNPATEEVLASFAAATPSEIDCLLEEAAAAQRAWRWTTFDERAAAVRRFGDVLRESRTRFAGVITAEMGKPIVQAEAEIDKCAWNCDFYAEHGEAFLAAEQSETAAAESYAAFEPLGVVLAIMPWNFPFWQVVRFLAPALMAGNGAVLKHASNVPQCAFALEEAARCAGLPHSLFRAALVSGGDVGAMIADDRIAAVTLTGSTEAGAAVASVAGTHLKKQVLELGGSDPFIVLADADLDAAAEIGVRSRMQNAGQSCIAAKRFIVEEAVYDEYVEKFAAAARALKVGDPSDRETNVGPLARSDLREDLARQVDASCRAGAEVVVGGHPLEAAGFYYAPTVLTGVTSAVPAFREETFGPVATLSSARDPVEAIELANETRFGLGASLWTRDVERAKELARQIDAGVVFINAQVGSHPALPFGGVKRSGYGRELGRIGIREFTNVQTVCVGSPSG